MPRVVLADDQASVRHSLRRLLRRFFDIDVVGEAASGPEAVAIATGLSPLPDVVLMDVRMPHGDGIAATRELAAPPWHLPVLIMTTFDIDEYLFGAIDAGAVGFLLKTSRPEVLADAIRAAARGEGAVSPQVTRRVLSAAAGHGEGMAGLSPLALTLTGREIDIVRALCDGPASNKSIARRLHVEPATVKGHLKRIMPKVGVRSRSELVSWAFRNGVVS
ncbi:MAG TPA: response regulator transcription factor [Pseudonocardiaceae bacterium]